MVDILAKGVDKVSLLCYRSVYVGRYYYIISKISLDGKSIGGEVVTDKAKRTTISISQQVKDALDAIKRPGQSYEGVIQELINLKKAQPKRG